jgi:hypothetical protein
MKKRTLNQLSEDYKIAYTKIHKVLKTHKLGMTSVLLLEQIKFEILFDNEVGDTNV